MKIRRHYRETTRSDKKAVDMLAAAASFLPLFLSSQITIEGFFWLLLFHLHEGERASNRLSKTPAKKADPSRLVKKDGLPCISIFESRERERRKRKRNSDLA